MSYCWEFQCLRASQEGVLLNHAYLFLYPFPVSPGHLLYVPLSPGQHRLGGTALAQCFSQLGEQPPNLDCPENLVRAFSITQGLLKGK